MAEQVSSSYKHERNPAVDIDVDAAGLAETGHKQELKPQYGLVSVIALGIVATNTWSAHGGSLTAGIYSGGPAVVIYGFLLTTLANLFVVLFLWQSC
jgi:choline transport protein